MTFFLHAQFLHAQFAHGPVLEPCHWFQWPCWVGYEIAYAKAGEADFCFRLGTVFQHRRHVIWDSSVRGILTLVRIRMGGSYYGKLQ
jgi:hypothetical protein